MPGYSYSTLYRGRPTGNFSALQAMAEERATAASEMDYKYDYLAQVKDIESEKLDVMREQLANELSIARMELEMRAQELGSQEKSYGYQALAGLAQSLAGYQNRAALNFGRTYLARKGTGYDPGYKALLASYQKLAGSL